VSISELHRIVTELLSFKRNTLEKRSPLSCVRDGSDRNIECKMSSAMLSDIPINIVCAVHFIEENLSKSLNLADIANQANLSKYHFTRVFNTMTGFSPLEFVVILKMHKAKNLLREQNLPVSAVAEEVGYLDLRNFDRRFKLHTGFTPSAYRKFFKS